MNNFQFPIRCHRSASLSMLTSLPLLTSLWFAVALVWFGCLNCLAQGQLLQPLPKPADNPAKSPSLADQIGNAPADQDSVTGQETDDPGISFGMTVPSDWEFGMQINSSAESRKISATFPVPRAWPEQEVEVLEEFQTKNVSKFDRKKPTKWTEQFAFTIRQMGAGQSEKAYVRFRIKKKMIEAPKDTSVFVKAKKVPGKLKEFLKPSPLIESKHKRIRTIAADLEDDSLNAWDQVEKNYQWVRENITYKFDKINRSCLEALDNKQGDCGELSSLFIALCRAQGVPARAVWIPGHTYPEFYLEDQSGNGHWFPCQAAGTYAFGSMAEIRPILQKGDRFKMPGEKEPVRYVRPTVQAFNAPVSMQWIRREVTDQQQK